MRYFDDMGVDVTLSIRQVEANLLDALNEVIALNKGRVELKEKLETRATTIKRLRRQLKEKEEKICQLRKKTPLTGEETPSEPVE